MKGRKEKEEKGAEKRKKEKEKEKGKWKGKKKKRKKGKRSCSEKCVVSDCRQRCGGDTFRVEDRQGTAQSSSEHFCSHIFYLPKMVLQGMQNNAQVHFYF